MNTNTDLNTNIVTDTNTEITSTEIHTNSLKSNANQGTVLIGEGCCCFLLIFLIVIFLIIVFFRSLNKKEKTYSYKETKENVSQKSNKVVQSTPNYNQSTYNRGNYCNQKPVKNNSYDMSVYYTETHITYDEMMADKGKSGEYSISRELEKINGYKKIMFNTYLPTEKDRTTEIDIILLHSTGIYIIESKNYQGWIIGDEIHENWQQTVWKGKTPSKYYFYNPIKQNSKHILSLEKIIGKKHTVSLVVFGDEATIKKAEHTNPNLYIINRKELLKTIERRISESTPIYQGNEIEEMYQKLRPYSGYSVPQEIKQKHIENIKSYN